MYTIMIVDDEYLVREGLKNTIDWESNGFTVIGEGANGIEGYDKYMQLKPDIIITDVRMKRQDGIEMVRRLRLTEGFSAKIVMLSAYDEFSYAKGAIENGVSAYMLKPVNESELINTLNALGREIATERKANNIIKHMYDQMPELRNEFLKKLLNGDTLSKEYIEGRLEFYEIVFPQGEYKVISIYIGGECIPYEKLEQVMYSSAAAHGDILIIPCRTGENNITAIVENSKKSESDFPIFLNDVKNQFHDIMNNFAVIGISDNYRGLAEVKTAYIQAVSDLNAAMFDNDNQCSRKVKEAKKIIKKQYSDDITVEMVAEKIFISPSYLMHIFKEETGKTFNQYLTEYRVETAKMLIKSGKYKVYEISSMVGYGVPAYFSSIFKKYTGMTPRQYEQENSN